MRILQKFFTSLKYASILLFFLSLISIIGTLIPQSLEVQEYLRLYPNAGHWILALGCDDLYHGWFFIILLVLLSISAAVCTYTRFKLTRKKIFNRMEMMTPAEVHSFVVKIPLETDRVVEAAKESWETRSFDDGSKLYFRCFGRSSLWGALMIHVGLLGILLGGLIDSQLGVETMIRGVEGEEVPIPTPDGIRSALKADRLSRKVRGMQTFNRSDPRIPALKEEIDRLGKFYEISLTTTPLKMVFEKLEVDYHETDRRQEMMSIKNWNSVVSVKKNGTAAAGGHIKVNQPLYFEDYSFFQTDWQKKYGELIVSVTPINASEAASGPAPGQKLTIPLGSPVKPDWSTLSFSVADFWPDFKMTDGQFYSASDELNNPAAQIVAHDASGTAAGRAWAFSEVMAGMAGHNSTLPYKFILLGANQTYQSGLQITSYPGTPLVWLGCFVFSVGMLLSFYIGYYETWLLENKDGSGLIAVTGNRHPTVLKRYLEPMIRRLGIELPSDTA